MKIAHCVEFYEPSKGGVQYHTRLLTEHFNSKYNIIVLTSYDQSRKVKGKNNNTEIIDFKIRGNLVKGYKGNINEYQNHLLNSNYDVIVFYAAQQWTFDLALPIIEKIRAKKIFITCGFSKLNNFFYKIYYNLILNNKIKYIDKFVFFSKITKDYIFLKKKIEKKKIYIIPNGGDKFLFKKKIVEKNIILYVANFTVLKNQLYLIIAMFFIKKKVIVNFVYSKKNYYYYLCKLSGFLVSIANKKIHFAYLFNLTRKQIHHQYKRAKLYVSTSKVECAPLMITDCVTSNLKFISSDVGNIKDILKYYKRGAIYKSFVDLIKLIKINLEIKEYSKKPNNLIIWKNCIKKYESVYKF
jgi:glycosyltransferase involved in cell wall biosynthesis